MNTFEQRCALAHGDLDSEWQWEPPEEPRPRVPTHKLWFKPNGYFVLDPWYPTGPLVRQPKPGTPHPELAKTSLPKPAKTGHKAVPRINSRVQRLRNIAKLLVKAPVVHHEGTRPDDPDEFFHFQDTRILIGPTVCGEYQVVRDSVQTERFYNRR